jgi:Kdo2-lipid IVA lauroyltransferase/acyltransferase
MSQIGSKTSGFLPRYWGLWAGIGLLWLLVRLPHITQVRLGRRFGQILHHLARERRRITETNIALCFPEQTAAEQRQLVRAAFESFGISVMETGTAWLRGVEHLEARCEVHGLEHVEQARADGRGVLLVGAHFSTLDLAVALAARFMDLDVVHRRSPDPVLGRLLQRWRERHYGRAYSKTQTRAIVRALQAGRVVWYAQDQNFGRRHAIFAPFFGVQAASIRGASRLAAMSGARTVFYSHFRLDGGRRYRLDFSPPLEDFPGSDEKTDATRINQLIETALHDYPEQYLWLHRRFKTRPEGEPPIYT